MPTTCEIELRNNPSQVVYTDETLRGTVHLTLTNEKVIHKAFVNIVGYGYVHWSENVKKQKYDSYQKKYFAENHTEERTSQENYLHKTVDFISNNGKSHHSINNLTNGNSLRATKQNTYFYSRRSTIFLLVIGV